MTFHPEYTLHQTYDYLSQSTEGRLIGTRLRRELIEKAKAALKALLSSGKGTELRAHNTFLKLIGHANNYQNYLKAASLKLKQSPPDLNGAEAEVKQAINCGEKIKECVKFLAKEIR